MKRREIQLRFLSRGTSITDIMTRRCVGVRMIHRVTCGRTRRKSKNKKPPSTPTAHVRITFNFTNGKWTGGPASGCPPVAGRVNQAETRVSERTPRHVLLPLDGSAGSSSWAWQPDERWSRKRRKEDRTHPYTWSYTRALLFKERKGKKKTICISIAHWFWLHRCSGLTIASWFIS